MDHDAMKVAIMNARLHEAAQQLVKIGFYADALADAITEGATDEAISAAVKAYRSVRKGNDSSATPYHEVVSAALHLHETWRGDPRGAYVLDSWPALYDAITNITGRIYEANDKGGD